MSASNAEILALVKRFRRGEDPRELLAELEAMARPPHRPKDPPDERIMRRVKRALVADAIYHGTLPPQVVPAGEREVVARAKGRRELADAAAAALVHASPSVVAKARRDVVGGDGRVRPLGGARRDRARMEDPDTWEEFKAYLLLKARR